MIEKQVIATWYTPEEKIPEDGETVLATVSGKGKNVTYDHAFALIEWYDDDKGWEFEPCDIKEFTVHAWCDIEPYKG